MKKVYLLITSILVILISLPAVAMEATMVSGPGTLLSQPDGAVKAFKGENGGNIFHALFREFQASKGENATLNAQIEDAVRRFPELLLIPDDDGQFATDFEGGTLLPLGVYQALGQRFQAGVYSQTPDPDREKFMKDVAPSLLATIAKGMMVDESALRVQAVSKRNPEQATRAKQALDLFKKSQEIYDNFVLNGSRGLLRIKLKGIGIPLFMLPVDYARKDFIEQIFDPSKGGGIEVFTTTLFKFTPDTKALKFINLANSGYSGLYPAFQNGGDYFDRFFTEVKDDPDYNDPSFLDGIIYAMSQVGHQKDGETPVVSKIQMDQLLGRFPGLREKIKSFPKPFGGLETYFDKDIKDQRVHTLLSRVKTRGEVEGPVQFVVSAVSKGWFRLPDYLMADFEHGVPKTFIDYFRAVGAYHGHRTVDPDFWNYLYSNQHFRNARVNPAVQAFLIGLDVSVRNKSPWSTELEVFQPGVMKALFRKDAEFTGHPAPKGVSTTTRVVKLITQANQLMSEMGVDSSAEIYQAANDAGFEILNGSSSSHRLNFNRKATKDEFLTAMSFLRQALQRDGAASLQRKIIDSSYPEGLADGNLRKLQKHRQNVNLCAAWLAEEDFASISEAARLKEIASRMGLSAEEAKNRLYRMEDNFSGRGYFIKDRGALERELP